MDPNDPNELNEVVEQLDEENGFVPPCEFGDDSDEEDDGTDFHDDED